MSLSKMLFRAYTLTRQITELPDILRRARNFYSGSKTLLETLLRRPAGWMRDFRIYPNGSETQFLRIADFEAKT